MPPQDPPSLPASRWLRFRSRRSRIVLGAGLLLVALIMAFDWAWFKPLIQHHIDQRSGRRVDFDELHIGLDRSLQLTFRLRNLVVQNAPWAARTQPLVRAGEFNFTLAWQSLSGGPVVLRRLELVDADLDLERQADGLRNWRLTRPDDRGPGRVRVQAIDARNTRAHVIDGGQRLELDLQVATIAAPITLPAHAALPLVRTITLRGTREATPFEAQVAVSAWPSFFDTGRAFALRADVQAGASRAHVDGTVADLMQLAHLDVGLQLDGPRIADLSTVAGFKAAARRWPALPSQARAQVRKEGGHWAVSALQARIGRSDLAGSFDFIRAAGGDARSTLRATLSSERLDIKGWRAARPVASGASAPAPQAQEVPNRLDADVDLQVATVDSGLPVALTAFTAHATQREGRVTLEAMQFALAGGRATGSLAVDTTRAPAAYALDLRLQNLQLAQLARSAATGASPADGTLSGGLNARLALRSQGDTPATLAAALAGTVSAELVRASIPDALDAKLALDGGHLLRSMFGSGKERAAVTCAVLDMRFDQGRGEARRFAFETGSVAVGGTGWVDLGRQSVDVLLTPRRKQSALLALDRSMRFSGPLASPKLALADRATTAAPAACAASTAQ